MRIDYEENKNRFIISVPYALADIAREFPNRLFDRSIKAWVAPALRLNVNHIKATFSPDVLTDEARNFIENFSDVYTPPRASFPVDVLPNGFKTKPRNYQHDVISRFWGMKAAAIFAAIGSGKSKLVIDTAAARRMSGQIDLLFVLCPASLKSNWVEQLEDHCPIPYDSFIVKSDNSAKYKAAMKAFAETQPVKGRLKVLIAGIESFSQSKSMTETAAGLLGKSNNYFVVVDESHNIKNYKAKRTKTIIDLTADAKYKWILTGTAISNGIEDLYSQYQFLNDGIMGVGSFYAFKARYLRFGGFENRQIIGYKNVPELMELIKPWTVELRKEDILPELPERTYMTRPVFLTQEQKKIYRAIKEDGIASLNDESVALKYILQVSLALQQITGGFMSHDVDTGSAVERRVTEIVPWDKNPKIEAMLDTLSQTRSSVIIWAKFTQEIKHIVQAIHNVYGPSTCVVYNGSISQDERDKNKRLFLDKKARFFVANPAAGGAGLTLNVSDFVIYYSNSFKLTDRIQSEGRNHRIGQKNAVTYVDLAARGTIDIAIINAIKKKGDLLKFVQDSVRGGAAAANLKKMWGDGGDSE